MNRAVERSEAGRSVAAFFDLDGTLVAAPSLERRFFAMLRYQRAIPAKNYFLWLVQAVRLAPGGIASITHATKMHLRGVPADRSGLSRAPTQCFYPDALERVAWHAARGHAIVLVTGTLAPLAHGVALALALRLASRGISASIGVCATRLEEAQGRWTGRIVGEAIIGEAKARAIRRLAAEEGFDLARCYAYGDAASDRWMLGAVGRPVAVNPSPDLRRIAHLYDWPMLSWPEKRAEGPRKAEYAAVANAKTESPG